MAETPVGYFPDVGLQWNLRSSREHVTEIQRARSGREQRRAVLLSTGLRKFALQSFPIEQAARFAVDNFLQTQRGRFGAFYFWNPAPKYFADASVGSVSAASRLIIPYRITNPFGNVVGTVDDVRVGGVSQAFTRRSLLPRTNTFAALRCDPGAMIDCGSSSTLRATGDQSWMAWVYVNDATISNVIAGNQTTNASGANFQVGTVSGKLRFRTNQAGTGTSVDSVNGTVPSGVWTHVAAVRSGTNVTFYVNGVATDTLGPINNPVAATISFRIYQGAVGGTGFGGMISDFRYYDIALAGSDILSVYTTGIRPQSNLRGWWQLVEGTGTTAADSSGYGNTGTLTNSPVWVSGEEEILFTGPISGAVTVWGTLRDRMVARFDSDLITHGYGQYADVRSLFDMPIQELVP